MSSLVRIPLSNNTVARRIDKMAEWVADELTARVNSSEYHFLQKDEYTDVQDLSHLLVFVRYIWQNDVLEDILFCKLIGCDN